MARNSEPRVVAYDIARLFIGPIFPTPRGIDRVDLAMARQIFADDDSTSLGILPTPWGMRAYPAAIVRRALVHLERLWAEQVDLASDRGLRRLVDRLRSPSTTDALIVHPKRALPTTEKIARMIGHLRAVGMPWGRSAVTAVPPGAVFLNIGQLGLAVPVFYHWLDKRPDITCAIMLHDVIPLEFPDLVPPGSAAHHARMVRTAARHAHCLIFNTVFARDSVHAAMAGAGASAGASANLTKLPNLVRSLPLPAAFADATASLPELAAIPYFVVVSTIEPRKNFALLVRVWARLIDRLGDACPHLIIVGARGYAAARSLGALDTDPALRTRIHEISGLSSPALAALVLGARAMLCPSRAEGFGLPVLEANAMGVPTIASDIPAHREIANADTILLPTDDDDAWEQAIIALPETTGRRRPPVADALTEARYCADLLAFANACADTGRQ